MSLIALFLLCSLPSWADTSDSDVRFYTDRQEILGGEDANGTSQDWTVALVRKSSGSLLPSQLQFCTAALISPSWALTAAHCVSSTSASSIAVRLGDLDIDSNSAETVDVEEIVIHPFYNPSGRDNDIALVKLAVPSTIDPVAIYQPGNAGELSGAEVTVFGWGKTNLSEEFCQLEFTDIEIQATDYYCQTVDLLGPYREAENDLQQLSMTILSQQDCIDHTIQFYDVLLDTEIDASDAAESVDGVFCLIADSDEQSPCFGDSGGPMIVQVNGESYLAGISSRGLSLSECGGELSLAKYSDVTAAQDFIEEAMGRDFSIDFDNFCPPQMTLEVAYRDLSNGNTEVTLYWDAFDQATEYLLRYTDYPAASLGIGEVSVDAGTTSLTIELQSGLSFYLSLQTSNGSCSSPNSELVLVQAP
jgi:secreted trypsin-like serine protease